LVIAFGGPQSSSDIRPFLANVLRGRRVAPGRVDEVAHHYEVVGGRSPITELTMRQAEGLRTRLAAAGMPLPVFVGMRNWHPYLSDTLATMARAGIRRAIGFIAAAHRSYSSCTQYRENVGAARATLARDGLPDVEVTYVADWYAHPLFVAANVARARAALGQLEPRLRCRARLVFTAHSIPVSMAEKYPYRAQFEETARRVADDIRDADHADHNSRDADHARRDADRTDNKILMVDPYDPRPVMDPSDPRPVMDPSNPRPVMDARNPRPVNRDPRPATVYQSRSGRPEEPWLGPDICDYLRDERARGLEAALICPVGFVCDHVEVLYDLDEEAAAVCREIGLPMVRAQAVNDHPQFLDMMADVVLQVCHRYEGARPLEVVAAT